VDRDQIISLMKAYFDKEQPPERLEHFATMPATDLLEDSADVMSFVLYLEDELGGEIRLDEVGPKLTSMTFPELADELCHRLNEKR
jgi:acyl carrier protein